jgi:hypothetical protein
MEESITAAGSSAAEEDPNNTSASFDVDKGLPGNTGDINTIGASEQHVGSGVYFSTAIVVV